MSQFKEAIEAKVGSLGSNFRDPVPTLSNYYGSNSLACHGLEVDGKIVKAYFIVPENLCGPKAKPPMFNQLKIRGDAIETETSKDDAKEHFIDTVVIDGEQVKVVPGHNLAGLVVEGMVQGYNQGAEDPVDLVLTGFSSVRYRGLVLPDQKLTLVGTTTRDEQGITYTANVFVNDQIKSKATATNFRCEVVDPIDTAIKQRMLAQHWLIETTAQGFGSAAALARAADGKIPILLLSEKTEFAKFPILEGDLITTHCELLPSPPEQGFGNTQIYVNGQLYGTQKRLMVQFLPPEKVAEGIRLARVD